MTFAGKVVRRSKHFLENKLLALYGALNSEDFVTIRSRPRHVPVAAVGWRADETEEVGVVLQGSIAHKDDFTLESVKLYRRNFPNALIVVSTWNTESRADLKKIEDAGAQVVTQARPSNPGISNLNLQIASSRLGLEALEESGAKFAVKSRTDQRMYCDHALSLLLNLVSRYPITDPDTTQESRIVGCSLNTFFYRMYGLSDMFMFGAISDMVTYWVRELDLRKPGDLPSTNSHREVAHSKLPEVFLCADFLKSTGWELQWTLRDSLLAFRSRLLIVDSNTIDLYWPKYTIAEDRWKDYSGETQTLEMNFSRWMLLTEASLNSEESILDIRWQK